MEERILKLRKDKDNYLIVDLRKNGKQKTLSSVDLDKLKKKVLDKKLEWIEFKDRYRQEIR